MERKTAAADMAPAPINEKPASQPSSFHDDSEKGIDHGVGETSPLKRRLKSRHLQMIAIGGTIGMVTHASSPQYRLLTNIQALVCSLGPDPP